MHVLDDAPARRDALQRLGDVLAELAQRRPAAARTSLGSRVHDPVPRQVVRQGTSGRLVAGEGGDGSHLVSLRRTLAGGFLQVLEAQFKLLDAGAAFRRRPEALAT